MKTPTEIRNAYISTLIEKFEKRWLQEIKNGKKDADICVRISGISNFELILNEFNPDIYTVFKEDGDTFVKAVITEEE